MPPGAHPRFRAHVTEVGGRLRPGERLDLRSLALVEIGPDGNDAVAATVATADIDARPAPARMTAERAAAIWADTASTGIRCWVIGGWGIDALLGRTTRDHHDLDLVVLDDGLPALLARLDETGFTLRSVWSENRWHRGLPTAFVADDGTGADLDVHGIGMDGTRPLPRSEHGVTLPAGSLDATGTIAGVRVPCATADAQRAMHTGYELPDHQHRDLALLAGEAG